MAEQALLPRTSTPQDPLFQLTGESERTSTAPEAGSNTRLCVSLLLLFTGLTLGASLTFDRQPGATTPGHVAASVATALPGGSSLPPGEEALPRGKPTVSLTFDLAAVSRLKKTIWRMPGGAQVIPSGQEIDERLDTVLDVLRARATLEVPRGEAAEDVPRVSSAWQLVTGTKGVEELLRVGPAATREAELSLIEKVADSITEGFEEPELDPHSPVVTVADTVLDQLRKSGGAKGALSSNSQAGSVHGTQQEGLELGGESGEEDAPKLIPNAAARSSQRGILKPLDRVPSPALLRKGGPRELLAGEGLPESKSAPIMAAEAALFNEEMKTVEEADKKPGGVRVNWFLGSFSDSVGDALDKADQSNGEAWDFPRVATEGALQDAEESVLSAGIARHLDERLQRVLV